MDTQGIRIKNVSGVLRYRSDIKKWSAKDRKNHFIGVQIYGDARHGFKDHSFMLRKNCVYFFNQRDDYTVETLSSTESLSVHFTTYDQIQTDSFCLPLDNADEFIALLQKIEILSKTKEHDDLLLLSTLYKLCDKLSQIQKKNYFKKDEKILSAKSYMDSNFKNSDCLFNAAQLCGLSPRRFNDCFKQSFETTPGRYITLQKIKYARFLLETQSLTVSEIADQCGFSDVYYFSKVFKQICGIPPSKWK